MKAEITETGCLMVMSENGLENFALECWQKEFSKPLGEQGVTLMINTYVVCDKTSARAA